MQNHQQQNKYIRYMCWIFIRLLIVLKCLHSALPDPFSKLTVIFIYATYYWGPKMMKFPYSPQGIYYIDSCALLLRRFSQMSDLILPTWNVSTLLLVLMTVDVWNGSAACRRLLFSPWLLSPLPLLANTIFSPLLHSPLSHLFSFWSVHCFSEQ